MPEHLIDAEAFRTLKHDIRNQLSNVVMAIEQLQHEVPSPSADYIFYINTMSDSCKRINELLNSAG